MRPTLRQLQYLVAIADCGKFLDAARMLNVSQPSLSAQIADAEAQLGATLIERGRNGAFLTPVGEEVVRRARVILTQLEDLKTSARQRGKGIAGRYRLGTLPTIGPYLLPAVVRELHSRFPDLRMTVREERAADLQEKLHDGRLDMVISTGEEQGHSNAFHLFTERLYVCAAQDDALSEKEGPVALDELRGREFLSLGYGHRLGMTVQHLADAVGAHVSSEYEGTSLDAVRQMAAMGVGVAILPSLYAIVEARRDPEQVVRPIDHPIAKRDISLLWRTGSPLSGNIESLGLVFREVAERIIDDI